LNDTYFDTLKIELGALAGPVKSEALNNEANLNYKGTVATISIDETTSPEDVKTIVRFFAKVKGKTLADSNFDTLKKSVEGIIPTELQRTSAYLTHGLFNSHHSEHEMLRYIKSLRS
jgi:glycine dehydrogenase